MPKIERNEIAKPKETNPLRYFEDFRQSPFYRDGYENFFKGKKISNDVTEDERREVFESNEAARAALVEYAEKKVEFYYDPGLTSPDGSEVYPQEVQHAIANYVEAVRRLEESRGGLPQDQIVNLDMKRSTFHRYLALILVEQHLAPTEKFGRALGRLILIQHGLDTYRSAKEPIMAGIKRAAGA